MPTMMVPSAAMRRLRREGLEISRRRMAVAPTAVIAKNKKPSPPPPYASVLALPAPLPRSNPAPTAPRSRLEPAQPPSAAISSSCHAAVPSDPADANSIRKGAQVRVCTRVGTACTGQPIVFWLLAVVDAAADEDSYFHVTYSYASAKLPRVARVALSDIRMHDEVPHADAHGAAASSGGSSSAVTSDRSARPPPQQNKAAPRPTIAGKKLPLLKKFEKEMKSRSKAILS